MTDLRERFIAETDTEASAEAAIAAALVRGAAGLTEDGVKAAVFLRHYCPALSPMVDEVLSYKLQQQPGVVRVLEKALGALAWREFMTRVQAQPGGNK